MNRRLVTGAVVAGALALGILLGSAGPTVVGQGMTPRDDLADAMTKHMSDMSAMHAMMMSGGSMMGDASMSTMPGPAASMMPGSVHDQHHPGADQ